MLRMSMSADMSWFPEPHSGCCTPSSWRPTAGFTSLLFGTWNVSQFSANTNKSLYEILLLFSLLGHFLGRFQGVDGRCYLASLGVSWHLRELESRRRWFQGPFSLWCSVSTCEHSGLTWCHVGLPGPPDRTWNVLAAEQIIVLCKVISHFNQWNETSVLWEMGPWERCTLRCRRWTQDLIWDQLSTNRT